MINILRFRTVLISFLILMFAKASLATGLVEVLEKALDTNVQISAASNNLESQLEGMNTLFALKKPTLSANFAGDRDWNLKNDTESDSFSMGITARYLLFDGYYTDHQIAAEAFRINTLRAEFEGVRQKVIYEAIIAYLNVLRDTRLVELSNKNVNVLAKQLDATISRFQLGELTRTDVAQARAALAAATSVLTSRKGVLYLANRTFETAVGIKPVDLDTNIGLPELPKSELEAIEFATKFNSSLEVNLMLEKRANALLEASRSKSWPTFNLSTSLNGGETSADQNFLNFGISLTGSLPLYDGGAIKSDERQAKIDLELSMVNAEINRLNVQQAVISAWSDYQVSSAVILARTQEVETTQLAYQGTLEEARLGSRTILDVLNAEQTLMNAQTNLETAKSDKLAAGYRLLLEMGTLTPSVLGLD